MDNPMFVKIGIFREIHVEKVAKTGSYDPKRDDIVMNLFFEVEREARRVFEDRTQVYVDTHISKKGLYFSGKNEVLVEEYNSAKKDSLLSLFFAISNHLLQIFGEDEEVKVSITISTKS